MRYVVEIMYETMQGDPAVRRYNVSAANEKSAIKLAQNRLERLKSFKKTHSGNATPAKS